MLRHWSQFVPNISTDIRGHEALHHHQPMEVEGEEGEDKEGGGGEQDKRKYFEIIKV